MDNFLPAISRDVQYERRKSRREILKEKVSRVSFQFRMDPRQKAKHRPYMRELDRIEHSYEAERERLQYGLQNFVCSFKHLQQVVNKTVVEHHNALRLSAQIAVASSVTDVSFRLAHLLLKRFGFSWKPDISKLSVLLGGACVTMSVFSLSRMMYSFMAASKRTGNYWNISSDFRRLIRKGNRVDEKVLTLFPHGIDAKLIMDEAGPRKSISGNKIAWKQFMRSVVLFTNTQKKEELLVDEEFLERVKLFVDSTAAEIWWLR